MLKIAFIAHDRKKEEMVNFVTAYENVFTGLELYSTGTTGQRILDVTQLKIHRFMSGPLGGDQQIGSLVAQDELDLIIFLRDPLMAQPHEPDITALLRLCDVYGIPVATNIATAEARLTSVVQDALNSEVTKRTVKDVLSTDRDKIMQGVQQRLVDDAKTFGIEIVDVRIKRVDFPPSVADSVYQRMKSERQQVANELRSTGGAEGEKIRADADRQREVLIAEAYRDAQKIKGEGDAKASALYAESFGRDVQFAQFYRNLDAYKASFSKKSDVMVLDPSSEFFKTMRGTGAVAAPAKR